ncbi:MAG TPA: hypothetical protein PKD32_02305 [Saprospiraceae bacterium]|nr:hypothetical protein [Saprospiraceae bacterium]
MKLFYVFTFTLLLFCILGVSANNQYTLTGTITFANPPATGTLTVSVSGGGSQVFNAPFTSPQNYSISGLTSGAKVKVSDIAIFSCKTV